MVAKQRRERRFQRQFDALERLFPEAVTELAVDLAEMHALTESLDHTMASHWLAIGDRESDTRRYARAWRLTGQRQTAFHALARLAAPSPGI